MATDHQQLTTGDGHVLEYYTAGRPDGLALLFHVGTPGCAGEFGVLTEAADELGLRLVCYSRPGYAGSTARSGRTVADAVADSRQLLDALGVGEFVTAGWSGGGPHALACAALLPDRCRAAATIAGVAPYDAHGIDFTAGMGSDNVVEFAAAAAGTEELAAFLRRAGAELGQVTGASVVAGMSELLSGVDRQALTGPLAEDMAANLRQALAGGTEGWRDDDLAFVRGWGFRPSQISVPVAVWQGRQDRMVPFEHGQWLAAEIPTAEPHLFAEEGHVSLIQQIRTILADLLRLAG